MNRADANQDNVLEITELWAHAKFGGNQLGNRPYFSPRS